MFAAGDYVVYGDSDVCRIAEIGVPEMHRTRQPERQYYFLETQFYKGVIYAPVDTQMPIRPVISRESALELIASIPDIRVEVCTLSDRKRLAEHYDQLMSDHSSLSLLRTVKSIYEKYHAPGVRAKLPNTTEASYYKKAGDLLLQELSVALCEPVEAVQSRIEAVCSPEAPMKWSL